MKRRALAFAALVAACVPATEDTDPRGGVVARLVPSAETSGKTFQSHDGWNVTIDKFAVRAMLMAERPVGDTDDFSGFIGGSGRIWIVAASERCELQAVAISVGPAVAYVSLAPRFSGFEKFKDELVCDAVDRQLLPYFERKADSAFPKYDSDSFDSFQNSPSLVLLAHAEKGGRTIRLELAIDSHSFRRDSAKGQTPTTIVANQGALVRIAVDASALFRENQRDDSSDVSFDHVADADANGDGLVTGAELSAAKEPCSYGEVEGEEDEYFDCDSILTLIDRNAPYVFGPTSQP